MKLPTPPLLAMSYGVIYADPPWSYRGRKQFGFAGDVGVDSGGAVDKYPTMSVDDICAIPVTSVAAADSLLFMWVTSPLLPDGLKVMSAWGFQYATVAFVWDKQRTNPGYYTLSQCEICIVGKRGRIPKPRGSRKERQFLSEERGEHSAKPEEVRQRIARMFPDQRRLEMFARVGSQSLDGSWDRWGLEAEERIIDWSDFSG